MSGWSRDAGTPPLNYPAMPLLFSYGTLQQESVQLSTFGRRLIGRQDELPRYEQSSVKIGETLQKNVTFNGNGGSRVQGMVFEIAEAELVSVDEYEAAFSYRRVVVTLASGRQAWVYVYERSAC
jgi:gamma-glutamylcyclotransferase (GGCT)/AIG2-like uncharacterized protein YtfP